MRRAFPLVVSVLLLGVGSTQPLRAQGATPPTALPIGRDVLAGRVTGSSGAIAGATVTVFTGAPGDTTRRQLARTDEEGRWLSAVQNGRGEYTVRATALGMKAATTTARRGLVGRPIVVDFKLEAAAQTLSAVKVVVTPRTRPGREMIVNDQAGGEKFTGGFLGAVSTADQGNLAAMAASIPGVLVADGGFSVLGLSASQNNVTLNGVNFGGGDIPRDGFVNTRVATNSYDVSRGGFSGGQVAIIVPPGGNFSSRLLHATLDAPALQTTDQVGRRLGQDYSNLQLSGAATGAIKLDKIFYNMSFQGGRRNSDLISLTAGDPFALQRAGVASDSVTRLLTTAGAKGIPINAPGIARSRYTDNASLLGRIDWGSGIDTTQAYITASLRYNKSAGAFLGVTGVPAHGGDTRTLGGDVSARHSTLLKGNILNDFYVAARINDVQSDPYSLLPNASILVTSAFADGSSGITPLALGGNAALPRAVQNSGFEIRDQASWNVLANKHRIRTGFNLRQDAFRQVQYGNQRGTFAFNSIDDFANNRPVRYSRNFVSRDAEASGYTASVYAGDDWRPTNRLQLIYGLRVDGNRFADRPEYNPAIDSRFGARTDFAPNLWFVSPRVGFSWLFGTNGTTGIPGFGAPWGQLRGGYGVFRNDVATTLLAPAMLASGLGTGLLQLNCIGSAIPTPNWSAYLASETSIPSSCAGGAASTPFSACQPNVLFIDSGFRAQESRRGSLAVSGYLIPREVRFTVEGTYSNNLRQQAPMDLNFGGVQRFALTAEGGRPVYAAAASVVPANGAVTNRDSRIDPAFGSVTAVRSDLRSDAKQLTVSVNPFGGAQLGRNFSWNAGYTLSSVRDAVRGFGGVTDGDPRATQWSRADNDFRHQLIASFYTRIGTTLSIGGQARFLSGLPYTPAVRGDINGDGLSNDRAFVFGTSGGADAALAQGMSSLIASASPRVRECLARQAGRVAARNSCEGPWTATANAVITLNPELFRHDNRVQVQLSLANVPAGLDAMLHGNSKLQGWGQPATPDNALLTVRGFDASRNAFRYEVNQRFGSTSMANTAVRLPFQATLEVRYQLGGEPLHQAVDQTVGQGRTRKGDKLTLPQMKNRLLQSVFNPIRGLLQAKDSLSVLTNEQLDQLTRLAARVNAEQDSIVTPFATEAVNAPMRFDREEFTRRAYEMQLRLFDSVVRGMRDAGKIFTQEQLEQFPPALTASFNIKRLQSNRPRYGFFPNY